MGKSRNQNSGDGSDAVWEAAGELLDIIPAGVVLHDEGTPVFANRHFVRLLGFRSAAQVLELPELSVLIAEGDQQRVAPLLTHRQENLSRRKPVTFEARRRDGTPIWLESTVRAYTMAGREVSLLHLVDVTERYHTRQAAQEAERRLRAVIDAVPHTILLKDRDGRYLLNNRAHAAQFGLKPSDMLGLTHAEIPGGDGRSFSGVSEEDRMVLEEGATVVSEPFELKTAQGEVTIKQMTKVPFRDETGAIVGVVGLSENITGRVLAQRELLESRNLLRGVFDALPIWISVKDKDQRYTMVNQKALQDAGLSADGFLGKRPLEVYHWAPEEMAHIQTLDEEVLKTGERVDSNIITQTLPNGKARHLQHIKLPFHNEKGEIQGIITASLDLTERFEMETRLREGEKLLQDVIDAMPVWVSVKDAEFRYILVNQAIASSPGVTSEGLLHKTLDDNPLGTPEQLEMLHAMDDMVLQRGVRQEVLENPHAFPDGSTQYIHHIKVPLFGDDQQVKGIITTSINVTERVRNRRALEDSEIRFRGLVEGSIQGILIRKNSKPVFVNPAFAEIFGYESTAEILAMENIRPMVAPEEHERLQGYTDARAAGRAAPTRYEFRGVRKDGSETWVECQVSLVIWDGEPATQTTVSEITERMRAEAELRESRQLLQTVFDVIPFWVFIKNARREMVMINRKMAEDLDLREQGIIANPRERLDPFTTKEQWHVISEIDQRVLTSGEQQESEEFNYTTPNGEERRMRTIRVPLKNAQGEVTGLLGLNEDITERLNTEQAMRQTQKLESLGVISGGIAHDFNNLLTTIMGHVSLMQATMPEDSKEGNALARVRSAAQQAADLCAQMLAYAGKAPFRQEQVNLNALIEETTQLIEASLSPGTRISFSLSPGMKTLHGDPAQLRQVVMNLLINANEALEEKPGTIQVTTGVVDLHGADLEGFQSDTPLKPGPHVMLLVRDTGVGMDAETQSRIFDPFFTTKFMGRGLGLASLLGIVRSHDAGLRVESTPGQGTLFTLAFPVNEDAASADVVVEAAPRHLPRVSGRVLVVEDDAEVRDVAVQLLESMGCAVTGAASGEQALARVQDMQRKVDLMLVDVTMPGMDGDELCGRVQRLAPNVKLVVASGHGIVDMRSRFQGVNVFAFLQKPYDLELLGAVVAQALTRES